MPQKYLPIFLLSLPYIVIDWNDRDGLCWITKLNNMIKYKTLKPVVKDEIETSFIGETLQKLGITIEPKKLTLYLYILFIVGWSYAYYQIIKKHKIKLFPDIYTKFYSIFAIIGWVLVTYL